MTIDILQSETPVRRGAAVAAAVNWFLQASFNTAFNAALNSGDMIAQAGDQKLGLLALVVGHRAETGRKNTRPRRCRGWHRVVTHDVMS